MNAASPITTASSASAPPDAGVPGIHIWDDPLSKIQFVQTVCKGTDWNATVFTKPDGGPDDKAALLALSDELRAKGYACQLKHDNDNGIDSLEVHHLGDHLGFLANLHELGFTQGSKRTFTHLGGNVGEMIRHGANAFKNLVSDPARASATAYFTGDLTFAAKTVDQLGHGHLGDRLIGLSGVLATAQSLIYMSLARDTGEVAVGDVRKDVEHALKRGTDPLDEENWRKRRPGRGPVGHAVESLRHHPIEAGAITQMAGQGLYGLSGVLALAKGETKEGALDLARSGASGLAWWVLMHDPKHYEKKHAWYEPERWKEEILSHPQVASAMLATGASLAGLQRTVVAARNESTKLFEWQKFDKIRAAGEVQYLVGDGVLFALNKSHYGGAEGAVDLGAEAAAKLIGDSSIVFGWKEEGDFVKRLSGYIGRRIIEETTIEKSFPDHRAYLEAVEAKTNEIVPRLGQAITEKLANRGRRFGSIAHAAAAIVHQFPQAEQPAVIANLAKALSGTKAVYASEEEFRLVIAGQVGKLAAIDASPNGKPTLSALAGAISDLQVALPGYDPARSTIAVYDALKPHCTAQQVDRFEMEKSLRETARRDDLPTLHRIQLAEAANRARPAAGLAS